MITRVMWIGAALLGLAAGTGFASGASVDFADLTDTITTTVSPDLISLGFTTTSTGPETVVVSGSVPLTLGAGNPGPRQVILTEPPTDFNPPNSDLVFLDVEPALGATGGLIGFKVRIEFDSDLFGPVVPSPNATITGMIPETGQLQDLSTLLSSGNFQITATSDLAGSEPTPLPASAWAGMALLGGLAIWQIVQRRKRALP